MFAQIWKPQIKHTSLLIRVHQSQTDQNQSTINDVKLEFLEVCWFFLMKFYFLSLKPVFFFFYLMTLIVFCPTAPERLAPELLNVNCVSRLGRVVSYSFLCRTLATGNSQSCFSLLRPPTHRSQSFMEETFPA